MQLQIRYLRTWGEGDRVLACRFWLIRQRWNPTAAGPGRSKATRNIVRVWWNPADVCQPFKRWSALVEQTQQLITSYFNLAYQQFFRVNNAAWCRTKDNCGTIANWRAGPPADES